MGSTSRDKIASTLADACPAGMKEKELEEKRTKKREKDAAAAGEPVKDWEPKPIDKEDL